MMKKSRIAVLALLVAVIMTTAPASAMFFGQAQIQATPAEEIVEFAAKA
jgi:hypothetical protein